MENLDDKSLWSKSGEYAWDVESEVDFFASLVNMQLPCSCSCPQSFDVMSLSGNFLWLITDEQKKQVESYVNENWNFCVDLWCWYMRAWKRLQNYFGIEKYLWVDQDKDLRRIFSKNWEFLHWDIISFLKSLPSWSIPFIMANNLERAVFPEIFFYWNEEVWWDFDLLVPEITRVLKSWWFVTTLWVSNMYLFFWDQFEKFVKNSRESKTVFVWRKS